MKKQALIILIFWTNSWIMQVITSWLTHKVIMWEMYTWMNFVITLGRQNRKKVL